MKEIPLTQGMVTLVDDEDYEYLSKYRWHYHTSRKNGNSGYATRMTTINGKRKIIRMHRVILNTPPGYETDHINNNGLDNRKENLRFATIAQNMSNRGKQKNNTSGYKGVFWDKSKSKWLASITINNTQIFLGRYKTKKMAAINYNVAAKKYHGEFALLNNLSASL